MFFRRFLCFSLGLFASGPVFALSCLKPDVVTQYEAARDSADVYSLVVGTIQSDGPIAIPERSLGGSGDLAHHAGPKFADTEVRIQGRVLTAQGFTGPFDRDVTLRATCISAWCPSVPDTGREVFAALKHVGEDRVLEISACPSNALPWTADDEARVLNCHRFGTCLTAD